MRIDSNGRGRGAVIWTALGTAVLAAWSFAQPSAPRVASRAGLHALGPYTFTDLQGRNYDAAEVSAHPASVFLFVACECPISNLYAPRLQRIADTYTGRGVQVFAVYSDSQESRSGVQRNASSHSLKMPVIKDDRNVLADRLSASYTPEAVVVDSAGAIRYRGRIDDNPVATHVSSRDLDNALDAILAGKPVAHPEMASFGCAIRRVRAQPIVTTSTLTYARDVAPILRAKCEGCHRPGQVAPFTLQDYKQASAWAPDIKRYTQNRQMPPWKPVPGYCDFAGQETRSLTDHERVVLAKWADEGAPLGNPKQIPPQRQFASGWELGTPDLVLQPAQAYRISPDGDDVYRNFVIKTNFDQDRWVRGVTVHPGNRAVVHHIIIYIDGMKQSDRLDGSDHDGQPGYTSFGGPGFMPTGALGGWVPGNEPQFLPEGVGVRIPKEARIVIQVHYHKDGKPETDLSDVGIYFAKATIDKEVQYNYVVDPTFKIPAGDPHYQAVAMTSTLTHDCHAIDVTPHMHWLGREMKVWATLPDGQEQPLIWIKDWDFNWQNTYRFKHPVALPKGTKLHMTACFDNSSDNLRNPNRLHPHLTTWGEQTTDEMCIAFVTTTRDDQHLNVMPAIAPAQTAANSGR